MRRKWFFNWYPVVISIGGIMTAVIFGVGDILEWFPKIENQYGVFIGMGLLAIAVFLSEIKYHTEFNNRVPIVSIVNSGVEKVKLDTINGLVQHREYYAYIEFANNPKHNSDDAVAKNVFAELFFFMVGDGMVPIYDRFEGLWYPYKYTKNISDKQEKENGTINLVPSGRPARLMIAQKYVGQDMAMVIENSKDYFNHYPLGSNTDYYQEHFLLHEHEHLVLIKLHGSRLEEKYVYRLWVDENEKLLFEEENDKKLCKKIILMKK